MKYLTINHYDGLEFEISCEIEGKWVESYFSVDNTDFDGELFTALSLYGLDSDLEEYEDTILEHINEHWQDHITELLVIASADHYANDIKII